MKIIFSSVYRPALIFLFLCVLFNRSSAQDDTIKFTSISARDGLLSNTVNAILKDHYGFVWFATPDGLDRFDGKNHRAYRFKEGSALTLQSKEINSLYQDNAERLWVGTMGGGLFLYDRSHDVFNSYKDNEELNSYDNQFILSICSDDSGKLWLGTINGITILEPETKRVTRLLNIGDGNNSRKLGAVFSEFFDSKKRMWVGTANGLFQYNRISGGFTYFTADNAILNSKINSITEFHGGIWIGTSNGLSNLLPDLKTFRNFRFDPADDKTLSGNLIYSLATDGNKLWIGSEGGLDIMDPVSGKVKRFNHDDRNKFSINSKSIRYILIDQQGIYWLGTYQSGVNKYDRNLTLFNFKQTNAYDPDGLNGPLITSFAERKDGDIYIGSDGGGLNLFHPQSGLFSHILIQAKEKSNAAGLPILSLMLDSRNELWIGTFEDGLFIYNTATGQYRQLKAGSGSSSINQNDIFCLKEDLKGNIWIGTNGGGVNVFDRATQKFTKYTPFPASPYERKLPVNGYIRAIEQDHKGNIWIGTYGSGIAVLNTESNKFRVYNSANTKMAIDRVFALLEDHNNNMWIGTGDGLFFLNTKTGKFSAYNHEASSDGIVHKILEDNSGNIWVSNNNGISSFNTTSKKFTDYSQYNGLQNDMFINGSGFRSSTGLLYFGGGEGFNYIEPKQGVKLNRNVLPVLLTSLQVNNKAVFAGKDSPLEQDISVAKQINLDYKQDFAISFTAINFTVPQQNMYAYKLKGFNDRWNYVGGNTTAYFTNMDPGEYVFAVKASNNDGIWNNIGTQIKIVIRPPIWRTWYAYLIYIFLVAATLLLIRHRGIKKIKTKLALDEERRAAEQLHVLDEMKIKFLTNLSHEFRTPISLIMAPADKLMELHKDQKTASQLAVIRRNARRLLNLVNQLLDFRKLEEHELKLNLTEGEIVSFIKDVTDSFHDLAESKKIKLCYTGLQEKLFAWFDHDKLERILFNLLSNAIKFTSVKGKVTVEAGLASLPLQPDLSSTETMLFIKVTDTGIGINKDKQELIFDRFFQERKNTFVLNTGSGIGLSIARDFARLHGGDINVFSNPGEGSTFIVTVSLYSSIANGQEFNKDISAEGIHEGADTVNDNRAEIRGDLQKAHLLVIEDNEDFRHYLKENLEQNYRVTLAGDGKLGWQYALSVHPDLILSDITMPFMDGITLSRKLKSDKRTSHIPVILITSLIREEEQLNGLKSGANDYLTKPFNFDILNIKINNLLAINTTLKNTYSRQLKVVHSDMEIVSSDEKFMHDVAQYIEQNLNNPRFSVVDLSNHFSMSRGALYSKILLLTGQPPVEFIRSYKLQGAAVLLEKSDMSVSEIAYAAGFATPHYFSKSFKAKYGVLPSEFRNKTRMPVVT